MHRGGVVATTRKVEYCEPKKVIGAAKLEFVGAEYGDAEGVKHKGIFLRIGDDWMLLRGSEDQLNATSKAPPWISRTLNAICATPEQSATKTDDVAVV